MYLFTNVRMLLYNDIPSFWMVCNIFSDLNPFLLRQVITHSAMQVQASSTATTSKSIAIVLQAGSTAASSCFVMR